MADTTVTRCSGMHPEARLPEALVTRYSSRPYDLRHAAVSLWLNVGVPPTEVARRAGHGVAVLLKVYANCIDGQDGPANQAIDDALGGQEGRDDQESTT